MQSWLMQKIARYSLQIITHCKSCVLLVAEVARCNKLLVTCYKQNPIAYVYLKSINISEFYLFVLYFQLIGNKKVCIQ